MSRSWWARSDSRARWVGPCDGGVSQLRALVNARGEAASADQRAQLGNAAVAGSDRTRAALGARPPGSRHRVLPAAAETNAFSLYHDYTESREGTDKYLNVVRTGSTVSKPSAGSSTPAKF